MQCKAVEFIVARWPRGIGQRCTLSVLVAQRVCSCEMLAACFLDAARGGKTRAALVLCGGRLDIHVRCSASFGIWFLAPKHCGRRSYRLRNYSRIISQTGSRTRVGELACRRTTGWQGRPGPVRKLSWASPRGSNALAVALFRV